MSKWTASGKDAIQTVFKDLGGTAGMIRWAKESPENQRDFYTKIWLRIVPQTTEITGAEGGPIRLLIDDEHARRIAAEVARGSPDNA